MVQNIQSYKRKKPDLNKNYMIKNKINVSDKWLKEKEKLGKHLLNLLFDCGAIKTWFRDKKEGWRLRSGLWSPVYISFREIPAKKNGDEILKSIGISMSRLIKNEIPDCDKILGLATFGTLISTLITVFGRIPSLYTRKIEPGADINDFEIFIKRYGEHKLIEGEFEDNDKIVIVDDLVTKLGTAIMERKKLQYIAQKRNKIVHCNDIVVVLDREQGADLIAKKENLNLHYLIPFKTKLHWLKNKLNEDEYQVLKEYFEDDSKFQDPNKIKKIIDLVK